MIRDSLRKVTVPQATQQDKESLLERVPLPICRGRIEGVHHYSISSLNSLENGSNTYGPTLYDAHDGGTQEATDRRRGDNPNQQDCMAYTTMGEAEGGLSMP